MEMTKNTKLVWRLGKLPSVAELDILIHNDIITKEEAREILFNTETEEDRDKKSLESEIKFLRDLVEKLSQGNNGRIIEIVREVEKPWRQYPWYNPYVTWCSANSTLTDSDKFSNFSTINTF